MVSQSSLSYASSARDEVYDDDLTQLHLSRELSLVRLCALLVFSTAWHLADVLVIHLEAGRNVSELKRTTGGQQAD